MTALPGSGNPLFIILYSLHALTAYNAWHLRFYNGFELLVKHFFGLHIHSVKEAKRFDRSGVEDGDGGRLSNRLDIMQLDCCRQNSHQNGSHADADLKSFGSCLVSVFVPILFRRSCDIHSCKIAGLLSV
jgi:hypothetical protein